MIGINKRPAVIPMTTRSAPGINCCFFSCCTCINWQFLKSEPGLLKIFEAILGSFCQSLAINFGLGYAGVLGSAYHGFLTTASWCLVTTLLLLFCYVVSEKSFHLVRQSLFETAFNSVASFSYLSACSYLGFAVNTLLYPMYIVTPFFQVYPAMTAAYILKSEKYHTHKVQLFQELSDNDFDRRLEFCERLMDICNVDENFASNIVFSDEIMGLIVGLIHGYDAYKSYRYFKGYR